MQNEHLPEPLRGSEIPSFTHYSIVVRLPDIARRTLAENPFSPEVVENIEQLIREIPGGLIRPVQIADALGADLWGAWIQPYIGQNWLQVPWFFAEEYFYVRILEAAGYFQPGAGQGQDPYRLQKRLGLDTTRPAIQMLSEQISHLTGDRALFMQAFERLLLIDLWGNQNDLSLWPASTGVSESAADDRRHSEMRESVEHLLVDDRPAALAYLQDLQPASTRLDILIDNAGYELVCDLVLADALLAHQQAAQVVFHVKQQPVFVSDALPQDVLDTLVFLQNEMNGPAQELANRLQRKMQDGQFQVRSNPFWTSPLPMWEMPASLHAELSHSSLLLSKGDANYRRLLGDRHWPAEKPFPEVLQYMPVPVLSLRTLKSEIVVGLHQKHFPLHEPDWMINGRWGLIQFANPAAFTPL